MNTKEKQIEEMANYICEKQEAGWYYLDGEYTTDVFNKELAEHLYNAGYRKQSEGEWLNTVMGTKCCSVCKNEMPYTKSITVFMTTYYQYKTKFCPNCGAKMKGGAE